MNNLRPIPLLREGLRRAWAGAALLLVVVAPGVRAHTDPPGATSIGANFNLRAFRADGTTPVLASLDGKVTECESILWDATLSWAGGSNAAFEGGTWTLTTPDGVEHPLGAVPCIGGTTDDAAMPGGRGNCAPTVNSITSEQIPYMVDLADVVNGSIDGSASIDQGFAHIGADDAQVIDLVLALQLDVDLCDAPAPDCRQEQCNPALAGPSGRLGECEQANSPDSTPCSDVDGNVCTVAGCESGVCVQPHVCAPTGKPECEVTIGDCIWNDADGVDSCQDPGDGAGFCPGGVAGVDVSLIRCADDTIRDLDTTAADGVYSLTAASVDANCVPVTQNWQIHVESAFDFVSPDDCGTETTDSDCDPGTGETFCRPIDPATDTMDLDCGLEAGGPPADCYLDGIPCPDTDGNICTVAACEAGQCVQDYFCAPPEGRPECRVTISGCIWNDADGVDSCQDAGDGAGPCPGGVDGVDVNLIRCGDNTIVDVDTTAGGGVYSVTAPSVDANCVPVIQSWQVHVESALEFVTQDNCGSDGTDSDCDTSTGATFCTPVDPATDNVVLDCGLEVGPPPPFVCRTPDFWRDHGGEEKKKSQNITLEVIESAGFLDVCGHVIDDTDVDSESSALEAMCIPAAGAPILELAQQLTALALNCALSGLGGDCAGDAGLAELFSRCNDACIAGDVDGCIDEIACVNGGGTSTGGVCVKDLDSCEDRDLCPEASGLCFEPPGPKGSTKACKDAGLNDCTVLFDDCAVP